MRRKLVVWGALAQGAVLESVRRKDLYVGLILASVMMGAAATLGRFGVKGLEMFLKDAALTVINLLSTVLAILFAARQMPEEISRRTVYPLLARPISRFDLILGKFLGAFALSALGLALFAAVGWGALAVYGLNLGVIFWQFLALRLMALAVVCALTIALSVFLTPQATVTMAMLLAIGSATFGSAVMLLDGTLRGVGQTVLRGLYLVLPQINLFDLSQKVSYGWPPVAAWAIWSLLAYALIHIAVLLTAGTLRFRKQAL